ncbi:hypothetical protein RI129_012581 [Pyrocoelia pectoralis]|uniref:Glucose-methanol-choline oxidoreductase N-terminal domain-containing protein n=1 Tax=Pyrocoelia pectoralis TaxID=417401 RepID=A0AAN7ZF23_9COLE
MFFVQTLIFTTKEYDFIIIGSGSAGSVVANRLSEISHWRVLLLEAGRPETAFSKTPMMTPFLPFTDFNWGYVTEPTKKACLGLRNKRCPWPRGKALGGTSAINAMIYARGNPEDYNRWANLGNPGWSYEDVLPYFLKSEDANLTNADPKYHKSGGYLRVSNTEISDLAMAFIDAGNELGYKKIDSNTLEQIGMAEIYATIKDGYRFSTASAFLEPVKSRDNLIIVTEARVGKILIDPVTLEAYGVEYILNDRKFTTTARKEVILSAGVLNSPQLLMLSGIGPERHLRELGIKPIQNLPVGQTLYDHLVYVGIIMTTNTSHDLDIAKSFQSNEGLPRLPLVDAIGYIATNKYEDKNYPDIEIYVVPLTFGSHQGGALKNVLGVTEDLYQKMYSELKHTNTIGIFPKLLHPSSVGQMRLKSSNPYDYPLFHPNYYSDPGNLDKRTLIDGIRFVEKMSKTKAFKKFNLQIYSKPVVGCEKFKYDSDEYWSCALEILSTSGLHQMSTCKMGPSHDHMAVVDNELKVYGIKKLRIADGSVIPIPLSGHLNAPTIMIGEKAADLIKEDWK